MGFKDGVGEVNLDVDAEDVSITQAARMYRNGVPLLVVEDAAPVALELVNELRDEVDGEG